MAANEMIFAFILIPVYLGATFALSRTAIMSRASTPLAFAVNWVLAAACLGAYTAATGLSGGNWVGVGVFSGALAATLATAISTSFLPKRVSR